MITVVTKMIVRPEKHREFVQTILAMVDPSWKQNGCLSREFFQDTRNEDCFVLLEEWETRKYLDHHFRSDWFHVLLGTRNLLQEEPQIKFSLVSHSALMRSIGPGSIDLVVPTSAGSEDGKD